MRINARSLPLLAAALLLVAAVAGVPGCSTSSSDSRLTPKEVKAFVTYDGTKTELTHFPGHKDRKLASLSEKGKDTIFWCSPDGDVKFVSWIRKSPFDGSPRIEDGCLVWGPPKPGSSTVTNEGKCPQKEDAGECYEYKIELLLKDGKKVSIDPRIEILP